MLDKTGNQEIDFHNFMQDLCDLCAYYRIGISSDKDIYLHLMDELMIDKNKLRLPNIIWLQKD